MVLRDKLISYEYLDTTIEHIATKGFSDRVRDPPERRPIYATPEERDAVKKQQGKARQQKLRDRRALEASREPAEQVLSRLTAFR